MRKPKLTWIEQIDTAIHRSLAQLMKAARRGDIDAMFAWLETLERQTSLVTRIDGALHREHRPRPQSPLPQKEPGKPVNAQGVEINPVPENELRAVREYALRRWREHLAVMGVAPRGGAAR